MVILLCTAGGLSAGSYLNECQMHPFTIDLSKLYGDKFMIAPHIFQSNYCEGECTYLVRHHTPHAKFQLDVHYANRTVPSPCCAPTKLKDHYVMYFTTDGKVDHDILKNATVLECGCV